MKVEKAEGKTGDFRVWCEHCSIRIAPNEEQIVVDAKPYHQRCYTKHVSAVSQGKDNIFSSGKHSRDVTHE